LCGHLLVLLVLIVVSSINYLISGVSFSYYSWYLGIPLIAGAIIGIYGVIVYTGVSVALLALFFFIQPTAMYQIPTEYVPWLSLINNVFSLLLIATLLCSILYDNVRYSLAAKEQTWLLQAEQQKLLYLSRHDSLTNLANRAYFYTYLQGLVETTNTLTHSITLFFMDLNRFKVINDTHGHHVGDQILLQTSKRLQKCLRKNDFIARIGGDEFTAVIAHRNDDKISEILAQRILSEFKKPFLVNNIELSCSISLGQSSYPHHAKTIEELTSIADQSMYTSKMDSRG